MLEKKDEQNNEVKYTVWLNDDKCLRENKSGKERKRYGLRGTDGSQC